MPQQLMLVDQRTIRLIPYQEPPLQPHQVRAEALLSGISHGTELNLYRGTSPFQEKRFDPDLRLFLPRDQSEQADERDFYPKTLGYEWVGRVSEIGAAVTQFEIGDLVHLPLGHQETHTFVEETETNFGRVEALPASLDPEDAIVLALAGVALQAVHDARIKVGDRVAVFGLGTIGLFAIQLARLNGATWIDAVDPIPARRSLAETYGADRVLDPAACDVGQAIKRASSQRGADVSIEVSGHYTGLQLALRSARMAGRVVAAGYYQGGGTPLLLGEEWHHNRLTLVSSMGVWNCPHRDYPAWNRARIHTVVTELLAAGRLQTDGLISQRIPFERAGEAYALIDQRPQEVIKVVLTY